VGDSLRSSGFPARVLPSATGCPEIAAAGVPGGWSHAKPRRREAAKEDAKGGVRCSVFEHEHEYEYEESPGWLSVARAFQPEFCPLRLVRRGIATLWWGVVSREAAKEGAKGGVRCSVFEHEHEESPGVLSVARAFQPEICPLRLDARRSPLRGCRAVGLTRSREAAKEDAKGGVRARARARGIAKVAFRSSGFPARVLPSATGVPGVRRTGPGAAGFTRSREAAKEDAKKCFRCSVFGVRARARARARGIARVAFRSSGFPARDLPSATAMP